MFLTRSDHLTRVKDEADQLRKWIVRGGRRAEHSDNARRGPVRFKGSGRINAGKEIV